ncbi:MAG: DNA methyltransferase [Pseudomonadota bacterium]
MKQGFHRHVVLAWHKTNPMPVANQHYVPDTEFFVHAWQKGSAPVGQISELGRYILGPVGKSEHDHPTVKPDYVMDKILRNVAGETIVDCFMGSGSTGVAAVRAGRTFIGVEHNPKHFELACQRIKAAVQEGCDHA